jgi:DNA-binding transcriptional regulator YiaG
MDSSAGVDSTARPGGPGDRAAGAGQPAGPGAAGSTAAAAAASAPAADEEARLPLLPGFREMALRRMSAGRQQLISDLAAQRQSAGLSQTEVAARMGTSQSAVARLEAGEADLRMSTLERYAAAIGSQFSWQLQAGPPAAAAARADTTLADPRGLTGPGGPGTPGGSAIPAEGIHHDPPVH